MDGAGCSAQSCSVTLCRLLVLIAKIQRAAGRLRARQQAGRGGRDGVGRPGALPRVQIDVSLQRAVLSLFTGPVSRPMQGWKEGETRGA